MVYDWKVPCLYSVSAQDAGEELERIYGERGKIDAADVVDDSRPVDAVLHPCFEWRDDIAAEKYREQQARKILTCLVTVRELEGNDSVQVRALFHVQGTYQPTQVIIQNTDKYNALYQTAIKELSAFRKKFSIISDRDELKEIFSAIDSVIDSAKKEGD